MSAEKLTEIQQMALRAHGARTAPDFLVWRCGGCGARAVGKIKPCECATDVGVREGPNGHPEQTWWDDPLPEMPRALSELVGAVGIYLGRIESAHKGEKARLERALDRALADGKAQYRG